MSLESCAMTFEQDNLWEITMSLFKEKLDKNRSELKSPYSNSMLFSFYESFISYPIDDLKDGQNTNRIDFYEAISIMSWAIYRAWVKKVIDESHPLNCFSEIPKEEVVQLFMENLDCKEGQSILDKINSSSA